MHILILAYKNHVVKVLLYRKKLLVNEIIFVSSGNDSLENTSNGTKFKDNVLFFIVSFKYLKAKFYYCPIINSKNNFKTTKICTNVEKIVVLC